jgi:hypothetical protein
MKHDLVVLALILVLFPLTLLVSAAPLTLEGLRGAQRIAGWTARLLVAGAVTTLAIHIFDFARVADLKHSRGNVGLDIPSAASATATEGLFQAGLLAGLGILLYTLLVKPASQTGVGVSASSLPEDLIESREQQPAHTR